MQAVKRRERADARILLASVLLSLAFISVLLAGGLFAYLLLTADVSPPTTTPKILPKQEPRLASSDRVSGEVKAIVRQYLGAGLQGRYDRLWSMLDAEKRALWPGETVFATFWKSRFQDYHLQRFTLGKVWMLPTWVNPETMTSYHNVLLSYVSLQLEPKAEILQQQQAPPEVLNPTPLFQNLPMVVQHTTGDRWLVLDGGPFDLEAPILPPIKTTIRAVRVPILMYHHIADTPVHDALSASLEVTPTSFTQQMDYLKAQGYHTITFNQLFNALYYNAPLPARPIILTFDDGYDDAYKFAYPILKAHGFSGMFYIITGKVGWQGQMTWQQMREMLLNGMQMGSHTIHHVDMGQVLLNSLEQAQQELQISQFTLQKNLGIPVQQFCYPSGEPFKHGSLALRQEIVSLLAQDGYIGATTDPGVMGTVQSSTEPFVLLRVRVDGRSTLKVFEQSL
jgi:peptidoglycan/xylan/chitin deacetylase (PgdA/CDA1 family)